MTRSDKGSGQFSLNFHSGHHNPPSCTISQHSGNVVGFVDRQTSSTRSDAVRRARANGIFSEASRKR